jgi:hypothetical protein
VNKAALRLDTDPEEFDVLEPTVVTDGGIRRPVLHFGDRLVNGAGFSRRLLDEAAPGVPILLDILRSIVEEPNEYPLNVFLEKDHGRKCDHACYRCLMRYGNQPYHGLLDWRLGLAFLEALLIPDYRCGLDGMFGDEAPRSLQGWPELARACGVEMKRRFGGDLRSLGGGTAPVWAFQLGKGASWAIISHPLWDPDKPTGIARAAYDELDVMLADSEDVPSIRFVNTFDLVRRPVTVYEALKKGPLR